MYIKHFLHRFSQPWISHIFLSVQELKLNFYYRERKKEREREREGGKNMLLRSMLLIWRIARTVIQVGRKWCKEHFCYLARSSCQRCIKESS